MRLSGGRRAEWLALRAAFGGEAADLHCTRGGAVEVVRMGRGEPIVLVPGLAGGWRLLAPLARQLARTNEVIVSGLRGDRGPFGPTPAATVGELADDLAGLLDGLRLERPTLLGVSFGGAVALELAVQRPGRIGALATFGTEARFHISLGAMIARRVLERFPLPPDSPFLNQFFNILHGRVPESAAVAAFVADRIWETDQGVMAARLRALEGFDVGDRLWRIDVPTLVLAGTRDVVVPPGRQRALAESIAGARFETIAEAGHIGFVTHGAELARRVGRLLRVLQGTALR
jgi:3-oxoadipate enol-lactonase